MRHTYPYPKYKDMKDTKATEEKVRQKSTVTIWPHKHGYLADPLKALNPIWDLKFRNAITNFTGDHISLESTGEVCLVALKVMSNDSEKKFKSSKVKSMPKGAVEFTTESGWIAIIHRDLFEGEPCTRVGLGFESDKTKIKSKNGVLRFGDFKFRTK